MGFFGKKPPPKQIQGQGPPKQTRGTIAACACPWCGKANDFRDIEDYGVEQGNVLACDHCGKNFEIKRVQQTKLIWLGPPDPRKYKKL